MAIVIKAFILCATDNQAEAEEAVFTSLNGAVFESATPVLDFVIGVEQSISVSPDYEDGTFVQKVPAATFMRTANPMSLPC